MIEIDEVIDAPTAAPARCLVATLPRRPRRRARVDLTTLEHVRVEMAHLYRRVDRGELEASEATKRAFVLMNVGKLIEATLVEKRIAALERVIDARQSSEA